MLMDKRKTSSSSSSSAVVGDKITIGGNKAKKPRLAQPAGSLVTPPPPQPPPLQQQHRHAGGGGPGSSHKGRIAGGSGFKDLSPLLRIISPVTKGTPLELRQRYRPTGVVAHGRFGVVSILSEAGGPDVSVGGPLGTSTSQLGATSTTVLDATAHTSKAVRTPTGGDSAKAKRGRGRHRKAAVAAGAGTGTAVRNKERVRRMKAAGNKIVAVKRQMLSSPANIKDASVREWRVFNRLAQLAALKMSYNFVVLEKTFVERREEDMRRYVDLVLEYADTQLDEAERNKLIDFRGYVEIAFQLIWAIWVAYREMEFVHHDLHKKNVLLQRPPPQPGCVTVYHRHFDKPSASGSNSSSSNNEEEVVYYTSEWVVKINDFGCSSIRLDDGTHVLNSQAQPTPTTDIESLRGTLKMTITDTTMSPDEAKKTKDAITRLRKGLTKAASSGCRLEDLLGYDVFDMLKKPPAQMSSMTRVDVYSHGVPDDDSNDDDDESLKPTSSSSSTIGGDESQEDLIKGKRLEYSSEVSKSGDANRSNDMGEDVDPKTLADVFGPKSGEMNEGINGSDNNKKCSVERLFVPEIPNLSPIKRKVSKLTDLSFQDDDDDDDDDVTKVQDAKKKGKNDHTTTWYTGDANDDDDEYEDVN